MRTLSILICAFLLVSNDLIAQVGAASNRTDAIRNASRARNAGRANLPMLLIVDSNGKKIVGNSGAKEKKDYVRIAGFSQQSYLPTDENSGQFKDQVVHGELKIIKSADEASPVIMEMLSTNEQLRRVELVLFGKTDDGEETEEYLIRLEGVRVVSVKTSMNTGNARNTGLGPIREEVVFTYNSIYWSAKDGLSAYGSE